MADTLGRVLRRAVGEVRARRACTRCEWKGQRTRRSPSSSCRGCPPIVGGRLLQGGPRRRGHRVPEADGRERVSGARCSGSTGRGRATTSNWPRWTTKATPAKRRTPTTRAARRWPSRKRRLEAPRSLQSPDLAVGRAAMVGRGHPPADAGGCREDHQRSGERGRGVAAGARRRALRTSCASSTTPMSWSGPTRRSRARSP